MTPDDVRRQEGLPPSYATQTLCANCNNPITQWDNGIWYHLIMGQLECSIENPKRQAQPHIMLPSVRVWWRDEDGTQQNRRCRIAVSADIDGHIAVVDFGGDRNFAILVHNKRYMFKDNRGLFGIPLTHLTMIEWL